MVDYKTAKLIFYYAGNYELVFRQKSARLIRSAYWYSTMSYARVMREFTQAGKRNR